MPDRSRAEPTGSAAQGWAQRAGCQPTTHLGSLSFRARIRSASFAVTMLDFGQRAPIQAFSQARLLSFARARSRRAGVIAARDMGAAFTLMRPNDLIWNYWVNNYLLGNEPPVFDILFWNNDTTRLPAAFHGD